MAARVTALALDGVDLSRGGQPVVRDMSFAAGRGERVALMGASGAGKTTVLRAIAGLEPLAAGTIAVDGTPIAAGRRTRELQRLVGMVFQFHHLFAHMTALQNVALAPVHVAGLDPGEAGRRAAALLEQLGVGHRGGALPHELSGGEAQRVAIARALAMQPRVLLLDEPTASLDPARRGELAATLRSLSADGTTLVIATHDADFARQCAARVLVLDGGRLVRDGAVGDVLA